MKVDLKGTRAVAFAAGVGGTLAFFLACGEGGDPAHAQLTEPVQLEEPVAVEGAVEVTNLPEPYVLAGEDPNLALRFSRQVTEETTALDLRANVGGYFIQDAFPDRIGADELLGYLRLGSGGDCSVAGPSGRFPLRDTPAQYVHFTGAHIWVPNGVQLCFERTSALGAPATPIVTVTAFIPRVSPD